MNPRLELYVSGSALVSRYIYRGGGRRIVILDPLLKRKSAVRSLRRSGLLDIEIARCLKVPTESVRRCTIVVGKSWIKTNLDVDIVGFNP